MSTLTLELPPQVESDEARSLLAIKLLEVGKLSLGQATRLSGLSRRDFVALLAKHEVSVFNYSPEDLRQEVEVLAARDGNGASTRFAMAEDFSQLRTTHRARLNALLQMPPTKRANAFAQATQAAAEYYASDEGRAELTDWRALDGEEFCDG